MGLHLVKNVTPREAPASTDPLDEMYERYGGDVKRWARRLAGPNADLEDLLHDVFVVAIRRGFLDRGEASITTWLFRITHHVVRNRRRRAYVRGLLFNRHRDELAAALPAHPTPQEEMERREEHAQLYRVLDRLPDRYRTALILYEIEGLSGERIAEMTGVAFGTIRVRLHRGRAMLLDLLAKEKP
jgi:RNA polymerase sigma-70 factor (ECF subfamily)